MNDSNIISVKHTLYVNNAFKVFERLLSDKGILKFIFQPNQNITFLYLNTLYSGMFLNEEARPHVRLPSVCQHLEEIERLVIFTFFSTRECP